MTSSFILWGDQVSGKKVQIPRFPSLVAVSPFFSVMTGLHSYTPVSGFILIFFRLYWPPPFSFIISSRAFSGY